MKKDSADKPPAESETLNFDEPAKEDQPPGEDEPPNKFNNSIKTKTPNPNSNDLNNIETIFISNSGESKLENYKGLEEEKSIYWELYDLYSRNLALLFSGDNKIIFTSYPINNHHKNNISSLLDWKNIHNISLNTSAITISKQIYKNVGNTRKILEKIIKDNPNVSLVPFYTTPEFRKLVKFLKRKKLVFQTPETIPSKNDFITSYFHSKRGFRDLWYQTFSTNKQENLFIPEGFITTNKNEAIEAAWWFMEHNKSFVIKYNKGVQGSGVIINHLKQLPTDKKLFIKYFKRKLSEKIWDEPCIIVEELIEINTQKFGGSPSIEFFIDRKGNVQKLYACKQILDSDNKTFLGIYINPQISSNKLIQKAFDTGYKFGQKLAEYGYRGYFDIDLVMSTQSKLYAVESNLRRTGGTHIHELSSRLLGKDYFKKYHIIDEDILLPKSTMISYHDCLDLLQDFIYDKKTKNGFIFGNPCKLKINVLHLIFFGNSAKEIQKLRNSVREKITEFTSRRKKR